MFQLGLMPLLMWKVTLSSLFRGTAAFMGTHRENQLCHSELITMSLGRIKNAASHGPKRPTVKLRFNRKWENCLYWQTGQQKCDVGACTAISGCSQIN